MSKESKIKNFDPNSTGDVNAGIFGLPFNEQEAEIIILPVPWEVTVSYSAGTANGPEAVFDASFQVDLYDPVVKDAWKTGIAMQPVDKKIKGKSEALRKKTQSYIDMLAGVKKQNSRTMKETLKLVNKESEALNQFVKKKAAAILSKGKLVAGLGGDHSTPLGIIEALAEKHNSFAILQLDAHADLRDAYEGFSFSHASIMTNALKVKQVSKLVQVGIRDYCEEEVIRINESKGRIKTYFDRDIKQQQYKGTALGQIYRQIISELPDKVYLSFDIDALDPSLCPNTGTPVPGGFQFDEALFLLEMLVNSGRTIIGFDLNEVSPGKDEWDANVGARLLYRICNLMAKSNGLCD